MTKEKKQKLLKILRDKLEQLQKVPYEDLLKRVDGEPEVIEHGKPESEDFYQMEIKVYFDDGIGYCRNLRVIGSIDDGGWSAFVPLCDSFIMTPEGVVIPLTKDSIPLEVEFYTPKSTGIEKFQFFYTRYTRDFGMIPVWTNFDIHIIEIAMENSPLAIIKHYWDTKKRRGRLLFDSMDKNFERFGVIDLRVRGKSPWHEQIFAKIAEILGERKIVGLWKLTPDFRKYFLEGDGIGRGAWWYIYVLRRPMLPDEFISLLEDHLYKYVRTEGGLFDPNKPHHDNIVVTPEVESFIFKDFSSARLCVSTSNTLISQKIIEFSRKSGIIIQHKIGDIDLTSLEHVNT